MATGLEDIKKGFKDNVINGTAYTRSKYITEITLNVGSLFIGAGEVKAASGLNKAGSISKLAKLEKATGLLDDAARAADKADDVLRYTSKVENILEDGGALLGKSGKATKSGAILNSADNPYSILKQRGIPSTLDDLDRAVLDGGNWQMKYTGTTNTDFIASKNGIIEAVGNGQHVTSRHIGKTDAELIQRISSNTKITASSTFIDESVANSVINSSLVDSNNVTKINTWLNNGAKGNLPIAYNGNTVIGRGISQGSNTVKDLTNAKIILKGNGNGGFEILTAYPSR